MVAKRRIRVMIVDDHEIMRDGLNEVLTRDGGFEVAGQAGDGAAAVKLAVSLKPDVIIMDSMMPVMNGVDACREITEALPDTKVLILTASTEEDAVAEAVAAGAAGYLQKYSGKEKLLNAVRGVADGEFRIPGDAIRRAFAEFRASTQGTSKPKPSMLTPREREILSQYARGMTNAQIAKGRGISPVTVRNALYAIQDKLAIETKQELVIYAVRNGLLDDYVFGET